MNNERLIKLILLYNAKELSEDESRELTEWIEQSNENRLEFERLADPVYLKHYMEFETRMQRVMEEKTPVREIASRRYWQKLATVAAALIVIAGIYMWRGGLDGTKPAPSKTQRQYSANDVAPGKFKAKLKLADGREIVLDSAGTGLLAQQGETKIYNEDGTVKYSHENNSSETVYNTLETATGETFPLTLSDGTKVWLNSESSIRFPVSFSGSERDVVIQGEVYFEVQKNGKPFNVTVLREDNPSEIQVLGTHFNVNAYADEPTVKTTLLEGRVAIKTPNSDKTEYLKPGQQASLDEKGLIKVSSDVNLDAVVAWKNQTFQFERSDLKTVMRQLSRWYGVSVSYESNIPDRSFGGMVSRNKNLSEVLKMLELAKIHFTIEGKKLTVRP
jgi:transmembrane sensor